MHTVGNGVPVAPEEAPGLGVEMTASDGDWDSEGFEVGVADEDCDTNGN